MIGLKTLWEKEKMLVTSIFSFFHNVFYSIKDRNHYHSNITLNFVVCKCFQFGKCPNFVVWERVSGYSRVYFKFDFYESNGNRKEKIYWEKKRENTGYQHFLLFIPPTYFCVSFSLFFSVNFLVYKKNFNIGHSFWMVSYRAFTIHMCITFGKTFSFVPMSRSSVKVYVKYQGHIFQKNCHYKGISASISRLFKPRI